MNTNDSLSPIYGRNLSEAWAKVFIRCWQHACTTPTVVHFDASGADQDWNIESPAIRALLESHLASLGITTINKSQIDSVANTIFPLSTWRVCHGDRQMLYKYYNEMWPLIRKHPQNRKGVYFQRLIDFGSGKDKVNQLEKIISLWNNGLRRHSAFQASIFNPHNDFSNCPFLGFPCLQQIIFHPEGPNGKDGLSLIALYANQLVIEKAYGNYLGLYRLGKFMSKEMGLSLKSVTCIASNLKLSDKHTTQKIHQDFASQLITLTDHNEKQ